MGRPKVTDQPKKRGGPNRGQGRKPLAMDGQTVRINITMTEAQRDKLKKLGGSAWVRQRIEEEAT